jgi:membrane-associated phospholipid phosphatase
MYGVIVLTMLEAVAQVPTSDPVLVWNEETLQAIRTAKTPPPIAARNLAMVHAAMYDAVNSVTRTHKHYLVDLRPPQGTSAEVAAAVAGHRVLVRLYPAQDKRFNEVLDRLMARLPRGQARDEGITLGFFVAESMMKWRATDGSTRRVALKPGNGPGVWKPTPTQYADPLLPQWPYVNTFALVNLDRFRPGPPPALTSTAYARAVQEVQAIGRADSRFRNPEQTQIALFWADGNGTVTPPGHWNRIAATVAVERRLTLPEKARLFALLNMALADAAVSCWDCKFNFNYWRPVTAIREAETAKNPYLQSDPTWKPLLDTPPFPSYTSGHSTFSSAAATVLRLVLGTDRVRFSSTSEGLPDARRDFNSFWEAAEEAGKSRIYGGIHYSFDNEAGLETGEKIGQFVVRRYLTPSPPPAPPELRQSLLPE